MATEQLASASVSSARLDAQILLADALKQERSWILAHDDVLLPLPAQSLANHNLSRRLKHIPVAYIRGWIEFYGRNFDVTPKVLIPRPETEMMIEMLKKLTELPANDDNQRVLIDIGTGSGCIGITAAIERPELTVKLTDIDPPVLVIAAKNAHLHKITCETYVSDLLDGWQLTPRVSVITANLPYVAQNYIISQDAVAEPKQALFANDKGYALIERLLPEAAKILLPNGYLLLESDPWQQDRIIGKAIRLGFEPTERSRFHLALKKA